MFGKIPHVPHSLDIHGCFTEPNRKEKYIYQFWNHKNKMDTCNYFFTRIYTYVNCPFQHLYYMIDIILYNCDNMNALLHVYVYLCL